MKKQHKIEIIFVNDDRPGNMPEKLVEYLRVLFDKNEDAFIMDIKLDGKGVHEEYQERLMNESGLLG